MEEISKEEDYMRSMIRVLRLTHALAMDEWYDTILYNIHESLTSTNSFIKYRIGFCFQTVSGLPII